jgi:phosphoribosylaminoimidazolecarboxamide formyltransferase/IMP cyclohydrolase
MPPTDSPRPVARALLSVFDKTGLIQLGKGLAELGIELVASGGTSKALRDAGLDVLDVADLTASPEMLGGRVKTLHPKIHGGILARRALAEDRADLEANGIRQIDLVVVNLYPFEATVADPNVAYQDAIEKIDIGGPSMMRSAAKKAFRSTASYDAAIQEWLAGQIENRSEDPFPPQLIASLPKASELRYGENPHQGAALYGGFLDAVEPLHGKALSYNNLVDVQAALALIMDFDPADRTAVGILKHNTPCGVGAGDSPLDAYRRAFETDPDSPFGGIIVCNDCFDLALAEAVDEIFTEVLVAPGFDDDALALLRKKKNRRLLAFDEAAIARGELEWRRVYGGVLLQQPDLSVGELADAKVVTKAQPRRYTMPSPRPAAWVSR